MEVTVGLLVSVIVGVLVVVAVNVIVSVGVSVGFVTREMTFSLADSNFCEKST